MSRIIVPDEALALAARAALQDNAPPESELAEIVVWHIDSQQSPPPAEVIVTARPASPDRFDRIAAIEGLRHVHLLSLGYEWVLPHLSKEVTLSNSKGAVENATAELTVAIILAALRELPRAIQQHVDKVWERDDYWTKSLSGSRVLVLGYGGVGSATVERIEPFQPESVTVLASRARTHEDGREIHGPEDLYDLLPGADVVVITVPHVPDTERLVDAAFLSAMRDGALLVNVGRGAIVDQEALMAQLRTGRIQAALDVVLPEPLPPEHPLWDMPNLLLTPHIAGNTHEFVRLSQEIAAAQIVRLLRGEPLLNIIER